MKREYSKTPNGALERWSAKNKLKIIKRVAFPEIILIFATSLLLKQKAIGRSGWVGTNLFGHLPRLC